MIRGLHIITGLLLAAGFPVTGALANPIGFTSTPDGMFILDSQSDGSVKAVPMNQVPVVPGTNFANPPSSGSSAVTVGTLGGGSTLVPYSETNPAAAAQEREQAAAANLTCPAAPPVSCNCQCPGAAPSPGTGTGSSAQQDTQQGQPPADRSGA